MAEKFWLISIAMEVLILTIFVFDLITSIEERNSGVSYTTILPDITQLKFILQCLANKSQHLSHLCIWFCWFLYLLVMEIFSSFFL